MRGRDALELGEEVAQGWTSIMPPLEGSHTSGIVESKATTTGTEREDSLDVVCSEDQVLCLEMLIFGRLLRWLMRYTCGIQRF